MLIILSICTVGRVLMHVLYILLPFCSSTAPVCSATVFYIYSVCRKLFHGELISKATRRQSLTNSVAHIKYSRWQNGLCAQMSHFPFCLLNDKLCDTQIENQTPLTKNLCVCAFRLRFFYYCVIDMDYYLLFLLDLFNLTSRPWRFIKCGLVVHVCLNCCCWTTITFFLINSLFINRSYSISEAHTVVVAVPFIKSYENR